MKSTKRKALAFAFTIAGLVLLFLLAVNTGGLKVGFRELLEGLFVSYNENVATIYDLRFPRIFIAMLGGAALAVSGVLLQAVMKNPLADPGIIGISSGGQPDGSAHDRVFSVSLFHYAHVCFLRRDRCLHHRVQPFLERRAAAPPDDPCGRRGKCRLYRTDVGI